MPRVKTRLLSSTSLKRFRDMADLDHSALQVVADNAELCLGNRGEKLVELGQGDPACVFLLQGEISLESGLARKRLRAGDREALSQLNPLLPKGGRIVAAGDEAALLLVKRKYLQAARLDYRQPLAASPVDFGLEESGAEAGEKDWMSVLLASPLFRRLEPGKLQTLLTSLKEKNCRAGEVVIQGGRADAHFYILKSGSAEVILPNPTGGPGRTLQLHPGSFFGEGALVGDTVHSATVRMMEAGTVCLLSAEHFDKLLKSSLLVYASATQAGQWLASGGGEVAVLDVRYPVEYRCGHRSGSLNIPINTLRERLATGLSKELTYLVDFGEDKRSQLAALLLIEHGYEALLLKS